MRGASTDADVFIVLYGKESMTSQKSLCSSKAERKTHFGKGAEDKFVIEVNNNLFVFLKMCEYFKKKKETINYPPNYKFAKY